MLTKSLHTITAATNVARCMLAREQVLTAGTAALVASDALHWLGYDIHPNCDDWRADPTLARILANCDKLVRAESATRQARPAKRKPLCPVKPWRDDGTQFDEFASIP